MGAEKLQLEVVLVKCVYQTNAASAAFGRRAEAGLSS